MERIHYNQKSGVGQVKPDGLHKIVNNLIILPIPVDGRKKKR
mgnify:CR=1 FL=1